MIETNPQVVGNVGFYYFKIRACVVVPGDVVCQVSQTFTVEIKDSCLETIVTQVVSTPIN